MGRVHRYLRWFAKESEQFVGEVQIDVTLLEFQTVFDVEATNPMFDCWRVTADHAAAIQRLTDHSIDLDRFDYFVEADGDEDEPAR
jgi:hypothetical protein